MGSLLFKQDQVESILIPEMELTLSNLGDAISSGSKLDIPTFTYSSYLYQMITGLRNVKSKCEDINSWLKQSVTNYSKYVNDTVSDIDAVVVSSFVEDNNHINKLS